MHRVAGRSTKTKKGVALHEEATVRVDRGRDAAATFAQAGNLGSGALYYTNGTIQATEQWGPDANLDDFEIYYDVDAVGRQVTYTYRLHVPQKGLSHWILELCPSLTLSDLTIIGATNVQLAVFGPGPSNPGMPTSYYGIKFDDGYGTGDLILTIITDRLPVQGNFYAKDGKNRGNDVYAFNCDPILVPGCERIPEPTGFVLTMAGLGLFTLIRRKHG